MKNSTKIIGLLALGFTGTFLYKFAKEKNTSMDGAIEGVELRVNPERVVDGLVVMSGIDERYRDVVGEVGKRVLRKVGGK